VVVYRFKIFCFGNVVTDTVIVVEFVGDITHQIFYKFWIFICLFCDVFFVRSLEETKQFAGCAFFSNTDNVFDPKDILAFGKFTELRSNGYVATLVMSTVLRNFFGARAETRYRNDDFYLQIGDSVFAFTDECYVIIHEALDAADGCSLVDKVGKAHFDLAGPRFEAFKHFGHQCLEGFNIEVFLAALENLDETRHVCTFELLRQIDIHVQFGDCALDIPGFVADLYRVSDALDADFIDRNTTRIGARLYIYKRFGGRGSSHLEIIVKNRSACHKVSRIYIIPSPRCYLGLTSRVRVQMGNMMQKARFLVPLLILIPLLAADLDTIKNSSSGKVNEILEEGARKREKILARFQEFKKDVQKAAPGLNIEMPVSMDKPDKIRLVDHDGVPGLPALQKIYAIVTKEYQLRTWHSESDSKKLDSVRVGDRVEVLLSINLRNNEGFSWALVRTSTDSEGYLPASYLQNAPDQIVKPSAKKEEKYVFVTDGLRLRSEPTTSGEFLVLVPYETQVTVTAYSNSKDSIDGLSDYWAQISYDGKTGWVFNGYLRPIGEKPKPDAPVVNPNGFSMPINGRLTSKFGPRIDPVTKKAGDVHRGIDIAAARGTPIKAAKEGEISDNSYNKWWGNYILIKHDDKIFTLYCHQSKTKARKGEKVGTGDVIGYVGTTGKSTGPHLHFEVRIGDKPTDPLKFVTLP
jgi:murein DD-endopeptidase MepM/ murein hydrolase activator NlpD